MAELQKQIIVPTLGLFQNRAKHRIPLVHQSGNIWKCGWSYCRNVSLSRKEECVKKSLGTAKFSASASGATDSVRGIGISDKYARPNNYESSGQKYVAANSDDQHDDGTTLTDSATIVRVGDDGGTDYDGVFRFDDWTIAQNTHIVSAKLSLWVKAKGTGTWKVKIYGDDSQDPSAPANHAAYAAITKTTAYGQNPGGLTISLDSIAVGSELIFDVTDVIQEIVNSFAHTAHAFQLLVQDNSSTGYIDFYPFNVGTAQYYAMLEIITTVGQPTFPTYFMYVKGATVGEVWKLNNAKVPVEVTQDGESYASLYQSQIAKFHQFGNDLLMTDDGFNDACQQWDVSDNPSALEDVVADKNGRYINEFKSRMWFWYTKIAGVLNKTQGMYSAVIDQTTIDEINDLLPLPGPDAVTFAINLTQDDQIVFKEGSTHRIVDQQTPASDFQPFTISSKDGSLGANVVSDGARLYGLNERGVFQWPVAGYPNGFRYIHKPIQDEIDKITLDKMNLVWFSIDPKNMLLHMHYPDTGYSRNILDAVFNITLDTWENISDIWEANVMVDCFDTDGSPIMLFGQEDGYLKYIFGTSNETANFTGRFDTGAVFQQDQKGGLLSRKLINIEPNTNYDGSMTLNFYVKGYNRPEEESGASWQGPYTHDATIPGNKEFVPVSHAIEYQFHMIRIDGTVKAEEFEIYELGLNFAPGSRNP